MSNFNKDWKSEPDDLADFNPTIPLVFIFGAMVGAFVLYAIVRLTGGW